jgi:hypothetical protein
LTLSREDIDTLVLATINAPYTRKLGADALVIAIENPAQASRHPGPMSSFFYDVPFDLQRQFAEAHGISTQSLFDAAQRFSVWSGRAWSSVAG